jgi:hypothetical protein
VSTTSLDAVFGEESFVTGDVKRAKPDPGRHGDLDALGGAGAGGNEEREGGNK